MVDPQIWRKSVTREVMGRSKVREFADLILDSYAGAIAGKACGHRDNCYVFLCGGWSVGRVETREYLSFSPYHVQSKNK